MPSHRSDPEWRERAECARADIYDPDTWFEDRHYAKKVCLERCPVLDECREWALADPALQREPAVIGGMAEFERRRLRARNDPRRIASMTENEQQADHDGRAAS